MNLTDPPALAGYRQRVRRRLDENRAHAPADRAVASSELQVATRRCIAVHGGIGATWEHDAHLYFRRAQLTRLLLGGQSGAGERVVQHVLG